MRAMGAIFFSAFYSWAFQIRGLIGPRGILPAQELLRAVAASHAGWRGIWEVPSLLRISSGNAALTAVVGCGLAASLLLFLNVWPRAMLLACEVLYMSLATAAGNFSAYQSDGMLLEAGLLSFLFAPAGFLPGLGEDDPPDGIGRFLLVWEWFRIYFESGVVKLASGDPQWRHLTAMERYYENGPLPTWIGYYVQQCLPRRFHEGTALATLLLENVFVWTAFLGRPLRLACFFVTAAFQVGILLTANYTFLNYLLLLLSVLLLDDQFFKSLGWRTAKTGELAAEPGWPARFGMVLKRFVQAWIFYATLVLFPLLAPRLPSWVLGPAEALGPLRVANSYGLFAVMTTARYEIEFQGTHDGKTWTPYPFRYKPQKVDAPPGLYAPYQPRFDWNLWFASLGNWRQYSWVLRVEKALLEQDEDVLYLFKANPFTDKPPVAVRAVIWRYWFSSPAEKRKTGAWWDRKFLGLYAPILVREPDGKIDLAAPPGGTGAR